MSEKSISIIVPAYNEENNIAVAVDSVEKALADNVDDYEIVIVDDGSTDHTSEVAENFAQKNDHVRVIHNEGNRGFGYSYKKGVSEARKVYVGIFPGDNDMSWESLRDLVLLIGQADIITSYHKDMTNRPIIRRILSRSFSGLMNLLFGMRLKYFNGSFICRRELLLTIEMKATSLIGLAECLVRLIKKGSSYKEISFSHVGRKSESSKALRLSSICAVFKDVFVLWKDIYFNKESK